MANDEVKLERQRSRGTRDSIKSMSPMELYELHALCGLCLGFVGLKADSQGRKMSFAFRIQCRVRNFI